MYKKILEFDTIKDYTYFELKNIYSEINISCFFIRKIMRLESDKSKKIKLSKEFVTLKINLKVISMAISYKKRLGIQKTKYGEYSLN